MDLNDPRRRLQVLNQANPSLRLAAAPSAPQPQIKVAPPPVAPQLAPKVVVPTTPNIQVGNTSIPNTTSIPAPQAPPPPPRPSVFSHAIDFLNAAGEKFGGGLARDLNDTVGLVRWFKPIVPQSFDHYLDNIHHATQANDNTFLADNQQILDRSTAGAKFGAGLKTAADVAQLAAGGLEATHDIGAVANAVKPQGVVARVLNKLPWVKSPKTIAPTEMLTSGTVPGDIERVLADAAQPTSPTRASNIGAADFRRMQDEALRAAGVVDEGGDVAQGLRFAGPGHTAPEAAKSPTVAKAIIDSQTTSSDPLTQIVHALSATNKKGTIRDAIEQLGVPVEGNVKNRLIKDLVNETDPRKVAQRILGAMDESAAQAAAKVPATATQQAEKAAEALPVPSGISEGPGSAATKVATAETVGQTVADNADAAVKVADRAEHVLGPGASTQETDAVQKIMDELKKAEAANTANDAVRSSERAQRISAARSAYEAAGGGEAGVRAKLAALQGAYSKADYTPIHLDPETEGRVLNMIESSKLRDFEKLNTQNALRKVWGAKPEAPLPSDINYIRRFFNDSFGEGVGDEMATGIQEALKSGQSIQDIAANVAGLPRALMATGDLSGGFRQALPLGTRFPKIWANANKESVKYALNPKYYESEMQKIADSDTYTTIADKLGVDLTGVGAMQDEAFIGAGYAEKIPVAGIGVRAADRAYTGVLTRMRYDVANKLLEKAGGADKYLQSMEGLYGDKADRAMRALGEVINTFTGRGGKKSGILDTHMKTASTLLFAPRLWAANLQRLNPVWYGRLLRDNPAAAKLALQAQGTFLLTAGTVLALAGAAGAAVGLDPRSADFGKIKVGNTRYDILGGQQQNIVQLARQITGEKINSSTGETQKLGDGYGVQNRFDLATDMFENKSNPLLGFGIKLMKTKEGDNPFIRKDQYGNDFNLGTESAKLVTPLGVSGAAETSQDVGSAVKGTAMNAPAFFGIGVQTYGNTKTKDAGTPAAVNKNADVETKKMTKQLKDNAVKGDYTLQQLPDGRWAAQIDGELKTFNDKTKAQDAIAKDTFTKGDQKSKSVRGTHYYKTKSGDTKAESDTLYNYKQDVARLNLEMDKASAAKDTAGWNKLAHQKYAALESKKSLYDPETEQDEIDKINLEQENLLQKMEKGASSGGKDPGLASLIPSTSFSSRGNAMPRFTVTRRSGTGFKIPSFGGSSKPRKKVSINL